MKGKKTAPSYNKKAMAQTVALILGVVSQAQAQAATVYGGGATLPAGGYVGQASSITTSRLAVPGDAGSLFAEVLAKNNVTVSYCQTGSGTGKRVLGGFASYSAVNTCGDFTGTPLGFSKPSGAAPDFAASDAPLSQTEYNSVITTFGAARTAPVQFPSVAGAIAIVFKNPDVVPTGTFPAPDLSDDTICKVFTGQITNWSQIPTTISGATFYPSRAINAVYRSDGSGTTFSFANHLTGVSACLNIPTAGNNLITDQSFVTVVSEYLALPAAGFTGASGNPGVANAVAATAGSIGYAELANALAVSPTLQYATVTGKSPASLAATLTLTTTTGQVVSSSVTSTGRPILAAVTGGAQTQCLLMVPPDSYTAPTSYPIVAVSNLLGYYTGNSTNTTFVRNVLAAPYSVAVKSATNTIGTGTGYAWLSPSLSSTVTSCVN